MKTYFLLFALAVFSACSVKDAEDIVNGNTNQAVSVLNAKIKWSDTIPDDSAYTYNANNALMCNKVSYNKNDSLDKAFSIHSSTYPSYQQVNFILKKLQPGIYPFGDTVQMNAGTHALMNFHDDLIRVFAGIDIVYAPRRAGQGSVTITSFTADSMITGTFQFRGISTEEDDSVRVLKGTFRNIRTKQGK